MKKQKKRLKLPGLTRPKRGPNAPPAPKTAAPADESLEAMRRAYALERQQKLREKQKHTEEEERRRLFVRRTRGASNAKAVQTARARSYYRFSRDFPSKTSPDGYRENAVSPRTPRRILWTAVAAALTFCLALLLTRTGLSISREPPAETTAQEPLPAQEQPLRMLRFSYDNYAGGDAQAIAEKLKERGCNVAVFEVKDEQGRLNLDAAEPDAPLRRNVDPEETLRALQEAGYRTCAYLCCFLDPAAAQWDTAMSVLDGDGGVWTDDAGRGWLNPYSARARTYLTRTVSAAAKAGFDYLLLDRVAFSADIGASPARYPGESEGGARADVLAAFIADALKAAGDVPVIVMARASAFDPLASADLTAYGGPLTQCGAPLLCVDARLHEQVKNETSDGVRYLDPTAIPFVFTLTAGDAAADGIADSLSEAKGLICVEDGDTLEETLRAAKLTKLEGYVIW